MMQILYSLAAFCTLLDLFRTNSRVSVGIINRREDAELGLNNRG